MELSAPVPLARARGTEGTEKPQLSEKPGLSCRESSPFGYGAGGGIRTRTLLPTQDFKSRASAVPPLRRIADNSIT